jgi:hypothetical protein
MGILHSDVALMHIRHAVCKKKKRKGMSLPQTPCVCFARAESRGDDVLHQPQQSSSTAPLYSCGLVITWLVQNARLRGLMHAAAWKHAGTERKKVVENQQFGELACSSS